MEKANQLGLEFFINHRYAKPTLCELSVAAVRLLQVQPPASHENTTTRDHFQQLGTLSLVFSESFTKSSYESGFVYITVQII